MTPHQLYDEMKEKCERYANTCFTGEEGRGRFLDMTVHFNLYINLKNIYKSKYQNVDDYLSYLKNLDEFHVIPIHHKNEKYKQYIEEVYKYLKEFWVKSHPLNKHQQILEQEESQFEADWNNKALRGWFVNDETIKKQCKEKFYCNPCKKVFINPNAFEFHKKSKRHIKIVNALATTEGALPTTEQPIVSEKMTVYP